MTTPAATAPTYYVRKMDMHELSEGCNDLRADGSAYCEAVHVATDVAKILAQNAALKAAVECADAYELRDDWREVLVRHGWSADEMVASIFIRKLRRDALKLVTP